MARRTGTGTSSTSAAPTTASSAAPSRSHRCSCCHDRCPNRRRARHPDEVPGPRRPARRGRSRAGRPGRPRLVPHPARQPRRQRRDRDTSPATSGDRTASRRRAPAHLGRADRHVPRGSPTTRPAPTVRELPVVILDPICRDPSAGARAVAVRWRTTEGGDDRSPPMPAGPTSRCSTRRSAPTWPARSPRTAARGARARHQGVRWTYDELAERVERCAGAAGLGLELGDRVGLWSPNYAEWTLLQFATAEIGVILVNVNPAYRTHELQYALAQSGCRMLFAAPSFKTSDYVEMVEQVSPEVPGLERAIFFWDDDWDELVAGAGATRRRARRRGATAARRTTRSTSSTRRARRGSRRAPRSPTATSSTTATSSPDCRGSSPATGCASRCPSTTASGW